LTRSVYVRLLDVMDVGFNRWRCTDLSRGSSSNGNLSYNATQNTSSLMSPAHRHRQRTKTMRTVGALGAPCDNVSGDSDCDCVKQWDESNWRVASWSCLFYSFITTHKAAVIIKYTICNMLSWNVRDQVGLKKTDEFRKW